jgi:ketosteroid isomerase-like protein
MKKLFLLLLITSCSSVKNLDSEKTSINLVLDSWHKNAAETKFDAYFYAMTDDAIFIGTDATENWNKEAFMKFSKPYFDKGKAWNFTAIERHVYVGSDQKTAWFDELLNTQMKICRGSGVLIKVKNEWKIQHYVLSMTIPNDNSDAVVKIKTPIEDAFIEKLKK